MEGLRSPDTDPEAERIQLDLLRRAGPTRRAQMALSLSAAVIDLARMALRRSFPEATEEEIRLRFVERHYGQELASGLSQYLLTRRP